MGFQGKEPPKTAVAVAVIATMVDYRQAFCRQCPTLAIQSFIKNGVRPSLIPILISFFEKRRMTMTVRHFFFLGYILVP